MKTLATLILLIGSAFGQAILGPILTGQGTSGGGGGGGGAGVAFVSSCDGHAVDNAVTSSCDTTGANLIVCGVTSYTGGPADAFQDSKSNTWTALTAHSTTSGAARETIYYSVSPTVGTGHTFANNTTGSYSYVTCASFSGIKTTSTLENQAGANDVTFTSAAVTLGSLTPATTGDLAISHILWSYSATNATVTIDSSYTKALCFTNNSATTEGGCLAYLITTGTSALNPAWTPSTGGVLAGTNAIFAKQ